jgi:hypothetical protein
MKLILPKNAKHSGIQIEYTKSRKSLYICGWYDSFVGIDGTALTLEQFFKLLGITEKDCAMAFEERRKSAQAAEGE